MYVIGTKFKERYLIWDEKGDIIVQCSNLKDAEMILALLNKQIPKQIDCERCEGKGEYLDLDYYPPKYIEKCEECNGTGYVEEIEE